ncbi:hypothetical protein SARC_05685 [Sphaeroforma arctica JP610]|uniref:Uncharacterized protein n=1 Tax=Sphaeroforma arctica JP610 TaxID=667725 RepID=A0A0L0FYX0_9EUKA|nr:hypothetical protein SARC_05685 [Sphaeroforma arctica JP610]KNC82025.1 hypothetical protein SARC_05685 [Sphaeroforma arctica JP610]|eukprot:XP_014155927.1 hypothetical protein SARC_05685 [Sphaeroforma arctica JP610]
MFTNRAIHEVLETCRRTCAECKVELNIIAFKRHLCQAQIAQLPTIKLATDYESLLHGAPYKCTLTKPRGSLDGEQFLFGQVSVTVHSTCDGDGVAIVYLQESEKYARLSLHATNHLVVERQEAEKKAREDMRRAETAEFEFMLGPLDDDRLFAIESSDESDIDVICSSGEDYDVLPFAPAPAVWTAMTVANMSQEEKLMYNCVLNDDALATVLPRRSRRTAQHDKDPIRTTEVGTLFSRSESEYVAHSMASVFCQHRPELTQRISSIVDSLGPSFNREFTDHFFPSIFPEPLQRL